ncbi:hypothetical protein EI94DRAFT_1128015 [Lactarius quietus]|nr:hypothetical protein EI94DRAFT_1128015 [Lactarius quietus]
MPWLVWSCCYGFFSWCRRNCVGERFVLEVKYCSQGQDCNLKGILFDITKPGVCVGPDAVRLEPHHTQRQEVTRGQPKPSRGTTRRLAPTPTNDRCTLLCVARGLGGFITKEQ